MPTIPQNDAGWRIEPPVSVPVAPIASRADTAAAEPPDEPPGTSSGGGVLPPLPRICHRAIGRGHVRRTHGELVHVRLAEEDRAVAQQVGTDGAFIRRHERVEDAAAGGGAHALGAEQVLDRQRNAGERRELAARECRIRRIGLRQRALAGHRDEGIQPRIERIDRREMCLGQFARGEFARPQRVARRRDGEVREAHSTTFGTAKKSPARSGALASTLSG